MAQADVNQCEIVRRDITALCQAVEVLENLERLLTLPYDRGNSDVIQDFAAERSARLEACPGVASRRIADLSRDCLSVEYA